MTFEEFWEENNCSESDPVWLVAKLFWEYQQKRIDELEEELKVLRDDNALTIAYMQGFSDAKAPKDYVVVSKQDLWRLYATGYCTDELRDICETIEQEQE